MVGAPPQGTTNPPCTISNHPEASKSSGGLFQPTMTRVFRLLETPRAMRQAFWN
jgi:hypothetical protein